MTDPSLLKSIDRPKARTLSAHAQRSDESAVEAVVGGDRDAFATLYDRHASAVFGLAKRMLRSDADAEAVVSDVFFEFWRVPEGFDSSRGGLRTYLLVRTRSRALDQIRRDKRHTSAALKMMEQSGDRLAVAPLANQPDRAAMTVEIVTELREAVAGLDPAQRKPLLLAFFDGFTHQEIAAQLGMPLGTVKSRVRAAMRSLRSKLKPLGRHDDELP